MSIYFTKLPDAYWEGNFKRRQRRELKRMKLYLKTHDWPFESRDKLTEELEALCSLQEIPVGYPEGIQEIFKINS
jgi:hypothetical protein